MKPIRTIRAILNRLMPVLAMAALAPAASAQATYTKANNTTALNLAGSWVGGTAPTSADTALWDNTVTGANLAGTFTANATWNGIVVNNTATGGVTIGATGGNTLTLGSGGINAGSSNQTLALLSPMILSANQTWTFSTSGTNNSIGAVGSGTTFDTTASAYTLTVNGTNVVLRANLTGSGGLTVGASNMSIMGDSTYTGATTIITTFGIGSATAGSISSASLVTSSTGGSLNLFRGDTTTFGNKITGNIIVNKYNGGTTTLTNALSDYTGTTNMNNGALSVSSLNSWGANRVAASNLGAPTTSANGTLGFGSTTTTGQLTYTGSGNETTDRVINLNGSSGGAIIDQSGNGLLKFTSNVTATGMGNKTLTLQGSTGGTGEISGAIVNNGNIGQTRATVAYAIGANSVTLASVDGASVGGNFTGTGFGAGTTITAIDTGTRVVTLSSNATAAGATNQLVTVQGVFNPTSLNKAGTGTWTLSGANTYTGATTVSAGTLLISSTGSISNASPVTVAAGARLAYNSSTARTGAITLNGNGAGSSNRAILSGTGQIGTAPLTLDNIGDTLSPGNSPGIQNYASGQTWNSFTYLWETNNFTGTTVGTDFDQITITGALTLSGGLGSYLLDLNSLTAGNVAGDVPNFSETNRSWTILTTTTGITGFDAANWTIGTGSFTSTPTWAGTWALSQSGNDLLLSYTAVPEPGAWAMVLSGLGMLLVGQRIRRRFTAKA
jgi:autotransporter-associated beta strand protein